MDTLMTLLDSNGISSNLLMELVVKITLLLGVASMTCLVLTKASASVRRTIWCCTFVSILLLPLLHATLPSLPLPRLLTMWTTSSATNAVELPQPPVPQHSIRPPNAQPRPFTQLVRREIFSPTQQGATAVAVDKKANSEQQSTDTGTVTNAIPWQTVLLVSVIALWLAGSFYVLLRTARDWLNALALRHRARVVNQHQIWSGLQNHHNTTLPTVFSSDEIATPIAIGVLRPAIILPAGYEQWASAKRRAALLHELAHIKSADNLARLLVLLVCALYWFHPLVWFGLKKLKEEQEKSADNFVLRNGVGASSYAQDLLEIVQSIQGKDHNERIMTTMGSYSFFPQRMRSILSAKQSRRHLTKTQTAVTFGTMLCVAISLSMFSTQPIAAETKFAETKAAKQDDNTKLFQSMADKQADAINNGHIDAVMSFYADDAVYINFDERHRGKREIEREFRDYIGSGARVEMKVDEATVDGDKATEIGTYRYHLGGNDDFVLAGRYRNEWQKQNGKWLITRDQNYAPDFSAIGQYTGRIVGQSLETALKALDQSLNGLRFNISNNKDFDFDFDWDHDFDFDFDNDIVAYRSGQSSSPLHAAIKSGQTEIVELLVKEGADINAPGPFKMTPLHMAAKYNQAEIAEILLKGKADPNSTNSYGQTPLYIASKYGNAELVKLLLKHGAKVNEAKQEK